MATDTWPKPSPPWLSKTLVQERRHKNSIRKQIFCFIQSGSELSQNDTNAVKARTQSTNRKSRLEPAIRDAQKLSQNIFPPWRPTLTSRSLQSIARPFQKRFREVFGNAWILIFYLYVKAWEENSLPKSHLGWSFLVFGKGKTAKENTSIFWFIWPLRVRESLCWRLGARLLCSVAVNSCRPFV